MSKTILTVIVVVLAAIAAYFVFMPGSSDLIIDGSVEVPTVEPTATTTTTATTTDQ